MSTIIGWMFSGFATRLYAGAAAVWIASDAVKPLAAAAHAVSATLSIAHP